MDKYRSEERVMTEEQNNGICCSQSRRHPSDAILL